MGLSILLSPRAFQFALFDGTFSRVQELGHVSLPREAGFLQSEQVEFLLNNYSLPGLRYSRVHVGVLNSDFAILPPVFAQSAGLGEVLGFSGGDHAGNRHSRISVANTEFCYGTDPSTQQVLERCFSNCAIAHAGAASIQLLFTHHALQGCNVFLNVHDGMIELAARAEGSLMYYNVFAVSGNEDILYYLLFMAEQFKLPGREVRLGLAGTEPAGGELVSLLRRFTGSLSLLNNDPSVHLPSAIASVPSHYYFLLLNQHLCAS